MDASSRRADMPLATSFTTSSSRSVRRRARRARTGRGLRTSLRRNAQPVRDDSISVPNGLGLTTGLRWSARPGVVRVPSCTGSSDPLEPAVFRDEVVSGRWVPRHRSRGCAGARRRSGSWARYWTGSPLAARVLADHPDLRQRLIAAIVPQALRSTVEHSLATLPTSTIPFVIGLIGLLFSGTGVVFSAYQALNHVAAVRHRFRAGFLSRHVTETVYRQELRPVLQGAPR